METKDNKGIDLSMTEIVAVMVRGGRMIILFALIFAVLLGGIAMLNRTPVAEQDLSALEKALEKAKQIAADQWEYNEKSPAMNIDPYNEVSTVIMFTISGVEYDGMIQSPKDDEESMVSYMLTRIQAQYSAIWSAMDLEKMMDGTVYEGMPDKYLREVVKLAARDGWVLQLKVIASNAEDCIQLAERLYAALVSNHDKVVEASCKHELVVLNDMVTKVGINTTIEEHQIQNRDKLQSCNEEVAKCEKALADAKAPGITAIRDAIRNVIIGALVGVLLAAAWLISTHFMRNRISGARQLENRYAMAHLGSLIRKKGVFNMLGYRVMSEKLWKDEQQALAYLAANSTNYLPESGQIVIASSLENVDEATKNALVQTLSTDSRKAVFVTDLAHNPEALAAVTDCVGIVLAERAFVTENADVRDMLKTAKRLDKSVCGFVLL